jgi:hypothetical protein
MWKDPIVEELHAIRDQIARKFDYDLDRIVDYFMEKQSKHPELLVTKAQLAARKSLPRPKGRGKGRAPQVSKRRRGGPTAAVWKDPIVEEIHAIRRKIAKECGYDIHRIAEYLRKKHADDPGRVVVSKQRRRPGKMRAKALKP